MKIEKQDILNVLALFKHPNYKKDIVSENIITNIEINGTKISLFLNSPFKDKKHQDELKQQVIDFLQNRGLQVEKLEFTNDKAMTSLDQKSKNPFDEQKKLAGIKHIIAVASGKGGVGKSTISSNLAVTLARMGYQTGLMDADIYGPSSNMMMGQLGAKPTTPDGKRINPIESYGVKTISMGYLTDPEMAVIWRGPMLMKAVTQFLNDVNWGELDFLIIDMPPGTGDVQLSITQQVNLSGAIIVTTPQDVALMDVKRGIRMFEKVNVPVLGVVENMSYHICSNCGEKEHIFGRDKVEAMVKDLKSRIIAQFPLDAAIVSASDEGKPIALSEDGKQHTERYITLIENVLLPLLQK